MLFISSPSKGAIPEVKRNKAIKRVDALLPSCSKRPTVFVVLAVLLILALNAPTDLHAQSSPSISIELSPGHSVPQNTAITATITLNNLDPASYSSLLFRADLTDFDPHYPTAAASCEDEDTGKDLMIEVDENTETFTLGVYKACSHNIYAHYTLDASISKADTAASSGKVELASASTRFSMSRYLSAGEVIPAPPTPGAAAWMAPDPTTFEWYVGEWVRFRPHTNVLLYLNTHIGVMAYGREPGFFTSPGETMPSISITVEEACENQGDRNVHWRRAINQGLWIGSCRPGDGFIALRHETDGVAALQLYEFRILARGENQEPVFDNGSSTDRSVAENASTGQEVGAPITAADDDDDALTYTLSGDDAGLFSIESETGQIKVGAGTELDYETQTGYSVTVSAHDGKDANGNTDTTIDATIDVAISIDNIDESGMVTLSSTQPQVGVELTAYLTDPDGSVTGISWQWADSPDGSANWTDIDGAMSAAYTPVAAGEGKYLRATASYADDHGAGKKAGAAADNVIENDDETIIPPPVSTIADAPENLRATAGNAEVTLRWEAPNDDGGADITGYAYRYKESGGVFIAYTDIPESGPGEANARSYTVTGLTNGLEYVFHVHAVNEHGGGLPEEVTVTLPTRVHTENEELPTEVVLWGNYPNPFNPETTIRYALPQAGNVRLAVYDLLGHEVAVLVDEPKPAGHHATRFDAGDLPSGAYVYRLQAQDKIMVQIMMLVK